VISGFCHEVDEICFHPGYYTIYSNSLPMFRDNLAVPSSRALPLPTLENGTDRLSQNVGQQLLSFSYFCLISYKSTDFKKGVYLNGKQPCILGINESNFKGLCCGNSREH